MSKPDQDDDQLLTTKEAARFLRLSPSTLATWRVRRSDGPRFFRIGGRVFYPKSELKSFRLACLRGSTSEYRLPGENWPGEPRKKELTPGRLIPLKKAA